MSALLSVIVPVYNVKEYLPKCLKSLELQNFQNIEFILVDDGSRDGSAEICDEVAGRDSRFQVIHQINQGVSRARNAGIKYAAGKYLTFVDADDYIDPAMYSVMLAQIEDDIDLYICQITQFYENEPETQAYAEPEKITVRQQNVPEKIVDLLTGQDHARFYGVWDKIFKTSIIKDNHLQFSANLKIGEDCLFIHQYLLFAKKIKFFDSFAPYHYLWRETSALRQKYDYVQQSLNRITDLFHFEYPAQQTQNVIGLQHWYCGELLKNLFYREQGKKFHGDFIRVNRNPEFRNYLKAHKIFDSSGKLEIGLCFIAKYFPVAVAAVIAGFINNIYYLSHSKK